VKDQLGPLEENPFQFHFIQNVALGEKDSGDRWHVPPGGGGEIVDYDHHRTQLCQLLGQVGSDRTGSAGHQDLLAGIVF
jgi:hypothetical protein